MSRPSSSSLPGRVRRRHGAPLALARLRPRRLRRPHLPRHARHRRSRGRRRAGLPTLTYLPQNSKRIAGIRRDLQLHQDHLPRLRAVRSGRPNVAKARRIWMGEPRHRSQIQFPLCSRMGIHGLRRHDGRLGKYRHGDADPAVQCVPTGVLRGLGIRALPKSLNILRPIAVTAELSESVPSQAWTNGNPNSTNLNWDFTVQYSLPFYNSHIGEIDNAFFKHLISITEFTFSKPISNFAPGTNVTTGTIQPGAIYMADERGEVRVALSASLDFSRTPETISKWGDSPDSITPSSKSPPCSPSSSPPPRPRACAARAGHARRWERRRVSRRNPTEVQ